VAAMTPGNQGANGGKGRRAAPGSAQFWAPSRLWMTLVSLALVVTGVLMLLPVIWVVVTSFESASVQFSLPPVWLPNRLTLSSYRELFASAPFVENVINSIVVSVSVVVGAAVISVLAAYAFAKLRFRGREVLFTLFLASLMLPSQVSAVPEFVVVKYLDLLNTQASLVVPALIQVIGIFLLRQHFRTIPSDLSEAARVDGAGHLRIIRHVMVPLSWPAISAVAVITAQYIWNDFFWPNLFITSPERMTAPLALVTLESLQGGGPVGSVFAGLTILSVPVVIMFCFFQHRLMEGVAFQGISR
jgi:multiple sugar transport system permease protein